MSHFFHFSLLHPCDLEAIGRLGHYDQRGKDGRRNNRESVIARPGHGLIFYYFIPTQKALVSVGNIAAVDGRRFGMSPTFWAPGGPIVGWVGSDGMAQFCVGDSV